MKKLRRVVVTGVGIISSLGFDKNEFFNRLSSGEDATAPIKGLDISKFRKKNAAQVQVKLNIPEKWCKYSRASQMALLATKEAINDAKINSSLLSEANISIGTMNGGSPETETAYCSSKLQSLKGIDQNIFQNYPLDSIAKTLSYEFGIKGMHSTVMTACASGTTSIGIAYKWIQRGRADIVICGGVDAFRVLTHLGLSSFRITSSDKVKPFDVNRSGILVGEGAGILILESKKSALERSAHIYCSVSGFGASCDANDLAHPLDDGYGMALAMKKAIDDYKIDLNKVSYINAHGTATDKNDIAELKAIKKVFGNERKDDVYVVSIKGAIGHTIGAAGGIEAVSTVLSMEHGVIPPNINCDNPEKVCSYIKIPNQAINHKIKAAISNSFGFGGNNVSILFEKV